MVSEAQLKANKKWDDKNPDKKKFTGTVRTPGSTFGILPVKTT